MHHAGFELTKPLQGRCFASYVLNSSENRYERRLPMKSFNPLLVLASTITAMAAGTNLYLGTLPNPTDIQKQLSSTCSSVAIAGATAIFGLLDDKESDSKDSK